MGEKEKGNGMGREKVMNKCKRHQRHSLPPLSVSCLSSCYCCSLNLLSFHFLLFSHTPLSCSPPPQPHGHADDNNERGRMMMVMMMMMGLQENDYDEKLKALLSALNSLQPSELRRFLNTYQLMYVVREFPLSFGNR